MDKKFVSLMLLFFLVFALFASVVVFNQPLKNFARASQENVVSTTDSLIIAPLITSIKADGKTKGDINVFIKSTRGLPLKAKKVSLTSTLGQLGTTSVMTDDNGKATFTITSSTAGISVIEATVDDTIKLSQKISLRFE